ncbi:MAG: UDP-glucose/GDP-mannose dehydrogenase family protein [Nitrospirae bacterium]|nr:UDP-glucose/GDP-mannose dehydrogenase family protein [Magnetococcales bacterium]HAT50324.1 GDP-mannose dehydrogenase [Alphaproteobacteria bacterium]
MSTLVVGFAGLTHLGLISSVAAASKGFRTLGYADDPPLVNAISQGIFPILEPNLPETFTKYRDRLTFTADLNDLSVCDIVTIALDVVTNDQGQSDLTLVRNMIDRVLSVLRKEALLVVLCQVPPGFTRSIPLDTQRLFYQVETLVFGNAIERATTPERIILGQADRHQPIPGILAEFLGAFGCPILPMRYESAELAKISINMCLIASVSVANMMAELCSHLGADWTEIVPALRLDKRIGPHAYLKPGLGISGGNLERDVENVCHLAGITGCEVGVAHAWMTDSRYRKEWPLRQLHHAVLSHNPRARIAILGLAYKENTASTKNSPALALIAELATRALWAYDPSVTMEPGIFPQLTTVADAWTACRGADVIVIMTPWPEFARLEPARLAAEMAGRVVIDPYRMLDPETCHKAGLRHLVLGAGSFT